MFWPRKQSEVSWLGEIDIIIVGVEGPAIGHLAQLGDSLLAKVIEGGGLKKKL